MIVACAASFEEGPGYVLRFPATVRQNVLHGQNGLPGQAGSLSLEGPIAPDGNAMLLANGLVASPSHRPGYVPPNLPVSYNVRAKFSRNRGTGSRVQQRQCDLSFSKY